jgi:hypothetical protein
MGSYPINRFINKFDVAKPPESDSSKSFLRIIFQRTNIASMDLVINPSGFANLKVGFSELLLKSSDGVNKVEYL